MIVSLIGLGCGTAATMTGDAKRALREADLVIGASRMLNSIPSDLLGEQCEKFEAYKPAGIEACLRQANADRACVVFSGDTGFFSGARRLLPLLEGLDVRVLPGISSAQALAARLHRPWQDWRLCSAHGVDCDSVYEVCLGKPVFFLTGGKIGPAALCRKLTEAGLGELTVTSAENLTAADERIVTGTAQELAGMAFGQLSVLLAEAAPRMEPSVSGLPDELFERADKIPMTKQEVRAVVLAKLAARPGDVCWDIGAGTGSVGIELAMHTRSVWAVERNETALALAEKNRRKLGAWNLHIVQGNAPDALAELPVPDAVFVGGSGGMLSDILETVYKKNPKARVCVSAIALETLNRAVEAFRKLGCETEIIQLSVCRSRPVAGLHMMMAQNPIWLITGQKP